MNAFSLIFGLVILGLFIIPVVYFQRSQNKTMRELSKSFKRIAVSNGINVSKSDFWDNIYGIGLDDKNNKLLYLKHNNSNDVVAVLDVNDVDKCSIEKLTEHHSSKLKHEAVVNHVDLVITHRNGNQSKDLLEFYDESVSPRLNTELELAEKWRKLISSKTAK